MFPYDTGIEPDRWKVEYWIRGGANLNLPGMSRAIGDLWHRPRGASIVSILCIGAGGGGGGGATGTNAQNRGGGGGGGPGGVARWIGCAHGMPDCLYIYPGYSRGGAAGVAGEGLASGGTGDSYVINSSTYVSTQSMFLYCRGGTGGNPGTTAAAGTGGAVANAPSLTEMQGNYIGFALINGGPTSTQGANGGAFGAGSAVTPSGNNIHMSGGAGGGGATSAGATAAGGAINALSGIFPSIPGGLAGAPTGGGGNCGWNLSQHRLGGANLPTNYFNGVLGTGGSGGGSGSTGAGGDGGNGGFGSGGGGGGGGITGGKGGNSMGIIIIAWA